MALGRRKPPRDDLGQRVSHLVDQQTARKTHLPPEILIMGLPVLVMAMS